MTAVQPRPDIRDQILSEARRPGTAEPTEIHIRPSLYALMGGRSDADPIPLVLDEDIPAIPGYEIHRALPSRRPAG